MPRMLSAAQSVEPAMPAPTTTMSTLLRPDGTRTECRVFSAGGAHELLLYG